MKVAELGDKLSKLKKEEVVSIAAAFYKLIPTARKQGMQGKNSKEQNREP